ncbi:hypothetical protein KKB28_09300 [bacterium]|nr:hypothetical protein [bacterium]
MNRCLIIVISAVLVLSTVSFAGNGEGYGAFSTGLNMLDASGLNKSVAVHNMEFDDNQWAFGGLGFGIVGPGIVLGGEGYGFSQEVSGDTLIGRISGGYGFFNIGYQIFRKGDFFSYPFLGIGGGGYTLRLVQDTGERDAQTLIEEANRMVEMDRSGFLLEFGWGFGYLFDMTPSGTAKNPEERGGIFVGLRTGYIFDPVSPTWCFEGSKLRNGPDLKNNTFFLTLQIGGGGGDVTSR